MTRKKDKTISTGELPEGVYIHFDGIKRTLPFRLADYGDDGALTDAQARDLAQRFELDFSLARELSMLLGYSLDIESEVSLARARTARASKGSATEGQDGTKSITLGNGSRILVEPHDKRKVMDGRRLTVIESCCYIWLDAGRPLTITTRADRLGPEQRDGPLVQFIQSVMGMITHPSSRMSGETLRRDLERVKRRFELRGDLPQDRR